MSGLEGSDFGQLSSLGKQGLSDLAGQLAGLFDGFDL